MLINHFSEEPGPHVNIMDTEVYNSKNGKGFKRIFKNFSFLTVGKIGGDFFNFILFVILSRKFGQEGIGQYSFAMGFTSFFAMLAQFGYIDYSIKEISRNKNSFDTSFQRVFTLNVIQSSTMLLLLLLVIPFLSFSYESKIILAIVGIYQITIYIIELLTAVFIAHEKMQMAGSISISTRIITTFGAIIAAIIGTDIKTALLFLPIMSVIQLLIVFTLVKKKFGKISIIRSFDTLKNTFKEVTPFGISDFLSQVYSRIDVVLIGFIIGEVASGVYNVGYRMIFFLLFIPSFASTAIFPIVTRLYKESKFEFTKMYNKSLNMMIIIGLPVSAGIWLIAPQLVGLIFGPAFAESAVVLRILSFVFLLKCFSNLMNIFLMSSDHQKDVAFSIWIVTIFSIIIFPILIYLWKIEGAALAVILSSSLMLILFALKLKPVTGLPIIRSRLLISLTGVVIFFITFSILHFSIFIVVPGAVLMYVGILLLFKDVRETELRMALNLIRNNNIT